MRCSTIIFLFIHLHSFFILFASIMFLLIVDTHWFRNVKILRSCRPIHPERWERHHILLVCYVELPVSAYKWQAYTQYTRQVCLVWACLSLIWYLLFDSKDTLSYLYVVLKASLFMLWRRKILDWMRLKCFMSISLPFLSVSQTILLHLKVKSYAVLILIWIMLWYCTWRCACTYLHYSGKLLLHCSRSACWLLRLPMRHLVTGMPHLTHHHYLPTSPFFHLSSVFLFSSLLFTFIFRHLFYSPFSFSITFS